MEYMDCEISVMMSVFNERIEWLRASVQSILDQTYRNFEFLIVVDNPMLDENCKSFLDYIASLDSRVHIFYNKENIGLPNCLNFMLGCARGRYIARMDADDISLPERFEIELLYMESKNADLVSCGCICIDEDGRRLPGADDPYSLNNAYLYLPFTNIIVHPSVIFKTEAVKKVGGYRDFRTSQDYDLWLRLLSSGYKIEVMGEKLINYRLRKNSIGAQRRMEQFYASKYQRILYKQRKKYGKDSYSPENYQKYIVKKKGNEEKQKKFMAALEEVKLMKQEKNSIIHFVKAFVNNPEYISSKSWMRLNVFVRTVYEKSKGSS